MSPDDVAGDQPTKPLPQDPGPTEPIVAPHVPVADLSTAPLAPAGAPTGPGPSRRGMWALVGLIAVLAIGIVVVGTLWLQRDGAPGPVATSTPSPSVSVTAPTETVDDGGDTPSEAPVEPEPQPTVPPEPTLPPDPTLPPEPTEPPTP